MSYVIDKFETPSIAVSGTHARFPVRRIYLVGRNYDAHAREMGHDPDREEPFFFQKPADVILTDGEDFPYPPKSSDVHHEVELVVALKAGGADIAESEALDKIYGYAVGIDMTRRDLQGQMKKAGRPWEIGKAFEHSAPISAILPVSECGHPDQGRIWLNINNEMRQEGDLNQLIWSVRETVAYLSGLFTLAAGDLIFTGTPAGVGPVRPGDSIACGVNGVGELSLNVT